MFKLVLLACFTQLLCLHGALALIVETTSGSVAGLINGTTPLVAQFLSIPFAKPPTGHLRFAPPVKVDAANGIIDATQFGPACPQYESAIPSAYSVDFRQYFINRGMIGEDCLTVSVWAPTWAVPGVGCNSNSKRGDLPIIVWIYGGMSTAFFASHFISNKVSAYFIGAKVGFKPEAPIYPIRSQATGYNGASNILLSAYNIASIYLAFPMRVPSLTHASLILAY